MNSYFNSPLKHFQKIPLQFVKQGTIGKYKGVPSTMRLKNGCKVAIASLIIVLFSTGCARTFTSRTAVLTMRITLTFDGTVDLSKFNYLLFFSRTSGITLPPNTAPFPYFPTPGRTFNTDYLSINYPGLSQYYINYYSTWSDYMIFGTNTRAVYKSGGTAFIAPTANIDGEEVVATQNFFFAPTSGFSPSLEVNGNTLTISFQIQQLTTFEFRIYSRYLGNWPNRILNNLRIS